MDVPKVAAEFHQRAWNFSMHDLCCGFFVNIRFAHDFKKLQEMQWSCAARPFDTLTLYLPEKTHLWTALIMCHKRAPMCGIVRAWEEISARLCVCVRVGTYISSISLFLFTHSLFLSARGQLWLRHLSYSSVLSSPSPALLPNIFESICSILLHPANISIRPPRKPDLYAPFLCLIILILGWKY